MKTQEDLVNEKLAKTLSVGTKRLNPANAGELLEMSAELHATADELRDVAHATVLTAMDISEVESQAYALLNWVAVQRGER